MAVAIFDVSTDRVVFSNSDFRALLSQAALPIEIFSTIVSAAAGRDNMAMAPAVAEMIGRKLHHLSDSTLERIQALCYLPIAEDAGSRCFMVTEQRPDVLGALASRSIRQNYLNLALEAGGIGAWSLDLHSATTERTPLHDGIFGYTSPALGWNLDVFFSHVHEDDIDRVRRTFADASDSRGHWKFNCRIRRTDGKLRWIEASGHPHGPGDNTTTHYIGIVRDITEEINSADQRRLLFAELHHRVRNNLAIVHSLISNTLSTTPEVRIAADALRTRVSALAQAHDLLIASSNEPVTLRVLIDQTVKDRPDRAEVEVKGDDIDVPPHHVAPLSMWLTELEARLSDHRCLEIAQHSGDNCDTVLTWSDRPAHDEAWLDPFSSTLVFRVLPIQLDGTAVKTEFEQGFRAVLTLQDFFKQRKSANEQVLTATTMMAQP